MTLGADFKHRDVIEKKSKHVTGPHVPQRKKRPPAVQAYMTPDVLNAVTAGMSKAFNPAEPRGPHGRWIVGIGVIAKDSLGSGKFIHGVEVNGQPYEWQSPVASHPILAHTAERAQVAAKAAAKHASAVFADPQTQVEQMDNGVLKVTYSEKGRQVERRAGRIPSDLIHKSVGMSKTAPDPAPDEHLIGEIEKHGTKGRPGYRLLHPGVGTGFSHRFESRGLSQKYKRARHENLKPRPLSGLGAGKGKFKNFMERDRRQLSDSKISADVRARMSPNQRAAAAAYEKSKAKYDGYGAKILAAKKAGNFTTIKGTISRDKTLIPEHKKALLEAIAAEEKKVGPAKAAKKAVAAPKKAAKKVAAAKPDNKEVLHRDLHQRIDAAKNTLDLEHLVSAIDQHGANKELRPGHVDSLLNHVAERHVQHREERVGVKRPAAMPPAKKVPSLTPRRAAAGRAAKSAAAKQAAAGQRPAKKVAAPPKSAVPSVPKTPDSVPAADKTSVASVRNGPNVIAVDIGPGFNDEKAMEAFLNNGVVDADGNKLIGQKPAIVMLEDIKDAPHQKFRELVDAFNKKNPKAQVKIVPFSAKPGGTDARARRGQKLRSMDSVIHDEKGNGYVVGFRAKNNTLGATGDLVDLHVARGIDSKGNVPEAVIIHPGYRGKKDSEGFDVDSNAVMIGAEDMPSVSGDVVHAPKEDAIIRDIHNQPIKSGGTPADQMNRPKKHGKGPDGPYNNADSPAGKHIAAGGDVWDAPNEGLAEFIVNNPDRFEFTQLHGGGVSASFGVRDLKTGKNYFLKQAEEGGRGNMAGDAANEVLIAKLQAAFGFKGAIPTRYAADPNLKHTWIIQQHVEDLHKGRKVGRAEVQYTPEMDPHKREWFQFHLLDYLVNQSDRHYNNWLEAKGGGARIPLMIDNGAAAFGHYGPDRHERYLDWLGIGHLQAPKRYIGALLQKAYSGRDREIEADLGDFMKKATQVDPMKLAEQIIKENHCTGREAAYLRGVAALYAKRLKQLRQDQRDVVKFIHRRAA